MDTHLRVLSNSYLMDTNMTGFGWFQKILVLLMKVALELALSMLRLLLYGAPFVTSILLLTEANFVQQKSLLSDKSDFCL